eukprot:6488890-Amphidinium_carterae.2
MVILQTKQLLLKTHLLMVVRPVLVSALTNAVGYDAAFCLWTCGSCADNFLCMPQCVWAKA